MRKTAICLASLLFLSGGLCWAADPPIPTVRIPVVPPPTPPPLSSVPLASDQLYVVDSDVKCAVLCSPNGTLKVDPTAGPLAIRAKFVDGSGFETRTYKGAFLYLVSAASSGPCELIIVPAQGDIIRVAIAAGGTPPGPGPGPGPQPDAFTKAIQDAYTAEADPQKVTYVKSLASLYGQGASMLATDTTIKTYGDLFSILKAASTQLLPAVAIPAVRKVIGAELNAVLGTDATKPIDKAATIAEFNKISAALSQVK